MTSYLRSYCRSRESQGHSSHLPQESKSSAVNCIRYRITPYEGNGTDDEENDLSGNLAIISLSGELPQLIYKSSLRSESLSNTSEDINKGKVKRDIKKQQPNSLNTMNIAQCFDLNPRRQLLRTVSTDNVPDVTHIWGRLSTYAPLFERGSELSSARRDVRVSLTIGNHMVNGRYTDVENGDYIVILKRVPRHCNCVCGDTYEGECKESHDSYFELCGYVNTKLVFTERPSIIQQNSLDSNIWHICKSQNMEQLNSNWFLIKTKAATLGRFTAGKAYFKVIHDIPKKGQSRLVLSLGGETFYLERVEVGSKLVLVMPLEVTVEQTNKTSMLTIIGCCTFVHNIVKATPSFSGLSKLLCLPLTNLLDSLPIADEQIKAYLMNNLQPWTCSHVCLKGLLFSYAGHMVFAEFAIKLMRILPIYFNQNPNCKKPLPCLTMKDFWGITKQYSQVIEFLPMSMQTVAVVFQFLRSICDLEVPFNDFQEFLALLENEARLLDLKMALNLFKIHQCIVLAILEANEGKKLTYNNVVKKVDLLLFTPMVPSYIYDELIQYLITNMEPSSDDHEDYLKCIKLYYSGYSFNDVTTKVAHQIKLKSRIHTDDIRYDLNGGNLFALDPVNDVIAQEDMKAKCFNYDIFKLNTKGLTQLRFNYSMNALLAAVRSPISLHLGFMAEAMIAIVEENECILKLYPKEREENLRDALSSLFKLSKTWHLEVIEKKLARFWGNKLALESITGPPNFHTRLWITTEKNKFNYKTVDKHNEESIDDSSKVSRRGTEKELQHIEEESYVIINSNVPI